MGSPRPVAALLLAALASASASATSSESARVAAALTRYRAIAAAGGWLMPAVGPTVRPGGRDDSLAAVRARLVATGDLSAVTAHAARDSARYDPATVGAVRAFQRRHGLVADGVLGPTTRAALAVSVERRIAQLEHATAVLARPAPARRWIRINVPRFWLDVMERDAVVLGMPVIVGRPSRPTPALDATISWIVLNPPWTVPPLLAYEDLLPRIRRDPRYLASRRIDVFDGWRPDARRLDPATIDWTTIGAGIRDLTLRQRPGADNAMGRVLFYMDNEHDVYLHDTPSRELFRRSRRDFSSGCIRVGEALALVREILRDDDDWSSARIDETLATGETRPVRVREPMSVRIVYQTAWVDDRDVIQFRDDIYDAASPRESAS